MNIRRIAQLSLATNFLFIGLIGGFALAQFVSSPRGEIAHLPTSPSPGLSSVPALSSSTISPIEPAPATNTPGARPLAAASAQGVPARSSSADSSNPPSRAVPPSSSTSITSSASSASGPASYGYSGITVPGQALSNRGSSGSVQSASEAPAAPGPVRSITGPVTPDGRGNSFVTKGQNVAVQNAPANSDGTPSEDLALTVTPATGSDATTSGGESNSSSSHWAAPFSHEQELFRAKWGWGAYAQAERAAWDASLGH